MSASSESIKHKLNADEIQRIMHSGNMDALLFMPKQCIPELEGAEWALRQCSYPGFVELFRVNGSSQRCSRFSTGNVNQILQGKETSLFGKEIKLTDLVVPESAQHCLSSSTDERQQPDVSEADDKLMKKSQWLECIVPRTKPRSDAYKSDFFISPEEDERRARKLAELTGLTGIQLM